MDNSSERKLSTQKLNEAVSRGIITHDQASALWKFLSASTVATETIKFDFVNFLYFFGALLVMSAMGWFMTLGWESFGGFGIALISGIYAGIFYYVGHYLWYQKNLKIPGGIMFTLAVWMTPLIIYGIQNMLGFWHSGDGPSNFRSYHSHIQANWIFMEFATLIAAGIVIRKIKFPFLVFTMAFTLWFLSMDLVPLIIGEQFSWEVKQQFSLIFGLLMLGIAVYIDQRTSDDYAFWLYLFGTITFWGSLSSMNSNSELGKFLYFLINFAMMLIAIIVQRRVLMVFGGLGSFYYIGHLSHRIFGDSLLFPFALSGIGLLFIGAGIYYSRQQKNIENKLLELLPATIRYSLPRFRNRK